MAFDGRRLPVRKRTVNPFVDRGRPPNRVNHGVALRELTPFLLRQVQLERLGNDIVKRLHDLGGGRKGYAKNRLNLLVQLRSITRRRHGKRGCSRRTRLHDDQFGG